MNIRELHTNGPGRLRAPSSTPSEGVDRPEAAPAGEAGRAAGVHDLVEISGSARATQAENQELDRARQALREVSHLSHERTEHISRRIRDGYYSRPEVVRTVARRLAAELRGRSDAAAEMHAGTAATLRSDREEVASPAAQPDHLRPLSTGRTGEAPSRKGSESGSIDHRA